MKYFIDTEFLEGTQKEKFPISLFRKNTPPTIDLISIGIVAEDGREYYAVSKDFNLEEAWNRFDMKDVRDVYGDLLLKKKKIYWLRENVLKPIWRELLFKSDDCLGLSNKQTEVYHKLVMEGNYDDMFTFKSLKALIDRYGKTNKEIAENIKLFCHCKFHLAKRRGGLDFTKHEATPEFYAYFADYDWVVFCWLFGKMMDLPNGFPMYCKDLKQILDDKVNLLWHKNKQRSEFLNAEERYKTFEYALSDFKTRYDYPIQDSSKSHNAIEDARWNKELFDFLNRT